MNTAHPEIARCPACGTRIRFHQLPSVGDRFCCPECEVLLEVIRNTPMKLDWATEEEERYGSLDNDHFHAWR